MWHQAVALLPSRPQHQSQVQVEQEVALPAELRQVVQGRVGVGEVPVPDWYLNVELRWHLPSPSRPSSLIF